MSRQATPQEAPPRGPKRSRRVIAVVAAIVVVSAVVLAVILPGGGSSKPRPWHLQAASRPLTQPVNQPVLWLQYGSTPTASDLKRAATTARVVVLNAWELPALRELKRLNPKITVLVYKDLSSTRSYSGTVDNGADANLLPAGVGYADANANHPDWFAKDASGNRIEWDGYPGHWQMAVWNTDYQKAWTTSVVNEVTANGWDGVMADNALSSLRYYSNQPLGDGGSDTALADGITQMVNEAGTALSKQGKLLIPNVSDGRLYPGRWQQLARYGGGMEEQYLHYVLDPSTGFLGDPDSSADIDGSITSSSDWDRQGTEVAAAGTVLVHTQAGAGDRRSFLYGYSSFLIAGGGFGAFSATAPDGYKRLAVQTEQTWSTPVTSAPPHKLESLRYRWFSTLLAASNPSPSVTLQVNLPFAMIDGTGHTVTSVSLAPRTGIVLKRVKTALPNALEAPITLK